MTLYKPQVKSRLMDVNVIAASYFDIDISKIKNLVVRIASGLMAMALFAMVMIPLLEMVGRRFSGIGIPGAARWVQHLTLWLGMLGAILATFQNRHLSIATAKILRVKRFKSLFNFLSGTGAVSILLCLTWASIILVHSQRDSPEMLGGWLPIWIAQLAMPLAFLCMAFGTVLTSARDRHTRLFLLLLAMLLGPALTLLPEGLRPHLTNPGLFVMLLLAILGMPLYAVLGGAGLVLFYTAEIPIAAIPAETYRIVTQPVLPSIPLFALAGTVLAAGEAPRRLVRLVQAWTSWLPGGPSLSTVIACAMFTALTGASGVTILALGALLLPIMLAVKHKERFSIGLLTASGSVGLLFPPSLPVILYGIYGRVAIDRLFMAAFVPGVLLVAMLAGFSLYMGRHRKLQKPKFELREAAAATWSAKGYLILPIVVLVGLFGGMMTLVETAALTAFWAILLETIFHRRLNLRSDLPKAMIESAVLVGALLAVMGLALGLVSYMVDAEIPQRAIEWVQGAINSKLVFLLVLNSMLLLVGALMDIFSAIVIVVPLIVPIGMAFGIDPAHLGVIFLANLELGYLTPPVGMNLFLSSLRFKRPLFEIWRTVVPFLVIFAAWVLLITYVPALTVGVLELFGH
ncbi:MAG: TRAP transporter large permease subunit [bacterium]